MATEEGLETLADAVAELAYGLWQQEQQRTAATAATSVEKPVSTSEAKYSGI